MQGVKRIPGKPHVCKRQSESARPEACEGASACILFTRTLRTYQRERERGRERERCIQLLKRLPLMGTCILMIRH